MIFFWDLSQNKDALAPPPLTPSDEPASAPADQAALRSGPTRLVAAEPSPLSSQAESSQAESSQAESSQAESSQAESSQAAGMDSPVRAMATQDPSFGQEGRLSTRLPAVEQPTKVESADSPLVQTTRDLTPPPLPPIADLETPATQQAASQPVQAPTDSVGGEPRQISDEAPTPNATPQAAPQTDPSRPLPVTDAPPASLLRADNVDQASSRPSNRPAPLLPSEANPPPVTPPAASQPIQPMVDSRGSGPAQREDGTPTHAESTQADQQTILPTPLIDIPPAAELGQSRVVTSNSAVSNRLLPESLVPIATQTVPAVAKIISSQATSPQTQGAQTEEERSHTPRLADPDHTPLPEMRPQVRPRPDESESALANLLPIEAEETQTSPTINVTIGRIEVKAASPISPKPAQPKPARPRPPVSLDNYLTQRKKGRK